MLCVRVILGLHVARLAARPAIVLAVFTEADVILGTAEPAILDAGAALLNLVALQADKILRHEAEISVIPALRQITNGFRTSDSRELCFPDSDISFPELSRPNHFAVITTRIHIVVVIPDVFCPERRTVCTLRQEPPETDRKNDAQVCAPRIWVLPFEEGVEHVEHNELTRCAKANAPSVASEVCCVDPCKTRMLTLKVPRTPAKRSVALIARF